MICRLYTLASINTAISIQLKFKTRAGQMRSQTRVRCAPVTLFI